MSQPEESGLERDYCAGQLSLRDLAEIYGISEGQSGSAPKAWLGTQGKERYAKGTQVRKSGTQKSKVRTKTDPKVSAEELISESGLSPQQSLFVAEYLIDQNATAAAERAGYSDPNYGRQLLTNPNVKRAIDSQLVASVSRTLANADEVLEKCGSWPRSTRTRFRSTAAAPAGIVGDSDTTTSGGIQSSMMKMRRGQGQEQAGTT